ncbi:hypothetical protein LRH25_17750 [Ideonella azotifigens]|uniref:Leucine Rich repeats (2 copies) n=1 Tax=Ideonella azotifigens TaxID=513160 RepID=A0ABN1K6W9_9BURK|nr:hypothetical protein [Ideonella azotifigens]MCD2342184.1 hypothetical protein [Ideonella azotifigens]
MSSDVQGASAVSFVGEVDELSARRLATLGPVRQISLTHIPLVTVRQARRLQVVTSVEQIWLWCDVTRLALNQIVQLPGLRQLDVLRVVAQGQRLRGFGKAADLQVLNANLSLTAQDLLAVCECQSLRVLGIQGAELTLASFAAVASLPALRSLDLEATAFDDRMARWLGREAHLASLDLGGTRMTAAGLRHLVAMQSLQELDLWATPLTEAHLELLTELPELRYVSLGGYEHQASLDPERVTRLLLRLQRLQRAWLDGIVLNDGQRAALRERGISLRC